VIKRGFSALGKLGIIIAIAIAFFVGLLGTVYYSLKSPEVKVPDIIGKDVSEGEQALDKDGLNMRRRATRYSPDAKPNTILDQSPHAGEIIKVGQTVAVVISRATAKEGESPVSAAEQNFSSENKNTNEESSTKNDNANANTNANANANANKNKNRNRNANNSNNSNNSNNANNKNANRNANNSSNRNANNRNANANRPPTNNANSNRSATNTNANRRTPPPMTTPPFIPNGNRRTP
jgi:beta-lactam-binding protein with PASTA domain